MIQIDDKLLSLDIFEQHFCCDLPKCQGGCCVLGQSGAPLEPHEVECMERELPHIIPLMTPEGVEAVMRQGVSVIDADGDTVTPLVREEGECAFTIRVNGITSCSIERAWAQGSIQLRKPISCHLYPIRVRKFPDFYALNYDKWDVCRPAVENGGNLNLPLYKFLKDALTRAYGEDFYREVEIAAQLLAQRGKG